MADTKPEDAEIKVAEPRKFPRICEDADGNSHFSEMELTFELLDYAPPAAPISVSQVMKAENVTFISSPAGWFGDWHPAPRKQLIFVLAGELETEVSDGEKRLFRPGDFLLVEDTAGKGHRSRVTGDVRGLAAAIPLDGD
ncbi:cupin domain-containing protein [Candidatus Eisenbacteria bacterium]|uniref:Cupin domain-containing protein n=1 Tax=Eiseniibacteriota bacterium TaxID=2212470 RepID=A0ABV6YNP2_UNCEI